MSEIHENWDLIISPERGWLDLHLAEIWRYRDLILMFVKRDFVAFYQQTILGPLWYIIQPLFTTLIFTVIFGNFAQIPTDGVPPFIFYLCGTVAWGYFATCLNQTANTFGKNAGIFGKVYFPRLTVPISIVIISMVQFFIQFALFLGFYFYFIAQGSAIWPNPILFVFPLLILHMAMLGLGTGILLSSFTTKYRDLNFAMGFCLQLWMYASPVVYPLSVVPERWRWLYMFNPMAPIIETFRYSFLGKGTFSPIYLGVSWLFTLTILLFGILFFNRIEKSFMDTI